MAKNNNNANQIGKDTMAKKQKSPEKKWLNVLRAETPKLDSAAARLVKMISSNVENIKA